MCAASLIPSEQDLRAAFAATQGSAVPTVPDIVASISSELAAAEPHTGTIIELVGQDQAITGIVLKQVNSSAFGLKRSVESIAQAVVLLGLSQLRNLVLGAAIQKHVRVQSETAKLIWQNGLDSANAALHLAREVQDFPPDEAYLAGLLHDAGAMIMAEKWPKYAETWQFGQARPVALISAEERRYGTNHAVVGYLFARHWKLPERLCSAVYLHHAPSAEHLEDSGLRALVAILQLAHWLVDDRRRETGASTLEWIQVLSRAKSELMLSAEDLEMLQREAALGFTD